MAIVMLCYARSGGTLLNQCLGSLPNTVVLSEVNPIGGGSGAKNKVSYKTVYEQAKYWYNIELKNKDFKNAIFELDEYCNNNELFLIIRDWTIVNFIPRPENNFNPSYDLLTIRELKKIEPKIFAFIRDSIDIWISRGMKRCNTFFDEYEKYINKLFELNIPIFKYEDFTSTPRQEFKKICDYINIEYRDVFDEYNSFTKVNGDIQLGKKSRGRRKSEIMKLKRKNIPIHKINEIERCKSMYYVNSKLNYPTTYNEKINIIFKFKKTISYYFKKIYDKLRNQF